jgi:adenine deaminase
MSDLSRLLSVARGDVKADLLLTAGKIINVFTGEIESADIAVVDGVIAGIGPGYQAKRTIDLDGSYVAPGLIDAHVHIESSLCVPAQFASAVVPRGVTTVVADPHEIANVAGTAGVKFMSEAAKDLPLSVIIMAPSCVPATDLATSGGVITAADLGDLRSSHIAHGLAEMMNFPGVLAGESAVLEKLSTMTGSPIDGHCPGVTGKRLNTYVAAGIGSDHESVTADEAREKLSRGLYLLIREATNAQNLDALLPVVTRSNSRRICFCTDDRTPVDLLQKGSVDEMVRRAIAFGIDSVEAIRMATLNTAEWFGLNQIGAIAPGRIANLFVFDKLDRPEAKMVFSRGKLVAESGQMLTTVRSTELKSKVKGGCRIDWEKIRWSIPAGGNRIRVIGSLPDQLLTEHRILPAKIISAHAVADVDTDVLKMLVIDRHHEGGSHAWGFIQGFGLKTGAIAGTVAHDHHNLVVIGTDDLSMQTASRIVADMGGGLAVAAGERVLAKLPLPVAGLMSDRPITEVASAYAAVVSAAQKLGSTMADPFMAMSFMTLEVIPSLKLTDRGLVDVETFKFVELFV